MRRAIGHPAKLLFALALATLAVPGCVSVEVGSERALHMHLSLRDAATDVQRLPAPLVEALLVQAQPGDALADTLSIAYSSREGEFAFYQLASWTERPVRQLPRLLLQRLEARGVARALGILGDPLRADWLLTVGVETLHHDLRTPPGEARLALSADLYDRRTRTRLAHRRFVASVATARADSSAAAQAMSAAVARGFDELLPWLEGELQRAASPPR